MEAGSATCSGAAACCSPAWLSSPLSSLTAGLANTAGLLVAARLVQGAGAALMAPAALSELTTSFREGKDRNTALGAWGAVSGIAAAVGVFLGGVFAQGPGWRWIFFVNPPICVRWR